MAIQTIKATMQMRYGLEEDLEPDQLTTGEWAVSTDARYVRMCFAPGIVLRMATYEAFEQDMVEIQTILATCRDIQAAVEVFERLSEQHKNDAASSALLSESWAHGETGIREVESEDNSKYWSEQSKSEADRAREEADRAAAIVGFDIDAELSETSTNPVQNKVVTGNFIVIAKELNEKLNKTGDASEVNAIFSQPESRSNIASGEKLSVIFGKIQRFFEDIKTVAFTGKFSDLSDAPQAVNNLASDSETDFLAAIQGKILDAKLAELNGKITDTDGLLQINNSYLSASFQYVGSSVLFSINVLKNLSLNANTTLYTLPERYRPVFTFYFQSGNPGSVPNVRMGIMADGRITAYLYNNNGYGNAMASGSYIRNDIE